MHSSKTYSRSLQVVVAGCLAIATVVGHTQFVSADVIAKWTFENFPDPNPGAPVVAGSNVAAEIGVGLAALSNGGTAASITSPAGNGSANSYSANSWDVNDYFEFETSSIGFKNLSVSWDQTGSATGPKNFKVQYSTNGTSYTDLPSGTYSVLVNGAPNSTWSVASGVQAAYGLTFAVGSLLDNLTAIGIRLVDTSTTAINNGTVGSGGTSRVDNFTFNGEVISAVPLPGTAIVFMIGTAIAGAARKKIKAALC